MDSDEDPFEGVDIDGLAEPTADEIDDWATLESDDISPTSKQSKPEASPAAGSSIVGAAAAPPVPAPGPASTAVAAASKKKDDVVVEPALSGEPEKANAPPASPPSPPPRAMEDRLAAPQVVSPLAASSPAPAAGSSKMQGGAAVGDAEAGEGIHVDIPLGDIPLAAESTAAAAAAPAAEIPTPDVRVQQPQQPEITPASPAPPSAPTANQDDFFDEDDLVESSTSSGRQQQASGWGLGLGGWGLGAIGGKLRQVAAGALADVKDLTETFQAALADVTGAEDEEEEAGRLAAMDRVDVGPNAEEGAEGSAADVGAGTVAAAPTAAPVQQEVLEPVEGASRSRGSAHGAPAVRGAEGPGGSGAAAAPAQPQDPLLDAGLQAIDAQVEHLASGAARAITSLWGGLSSVAKVVAAEVVASVHDVQSSEAVRGVAQIGSKLAHTAERGLETVGRTAMVLLEEVAGVHPNRRRIWGDEADARAADMGRDPATFQDFFYIYGGEQLSEEVGQLSNECAHLCNKSRARLEAEQQAALDGVASRLGPYFNDPWVMQASGHTAAHGADAADGGAAAAGSSPPELPPLDESSKAATEVLSQMHDPISYLCQDSLARADAFLHQLREALEEQRTRAAQQAASPKQEQAQGGNQAGGEEEDEVEEDESGPPQQGRDPRVLVESFRTHCTKRIAEVCTAQLQLMLNMGASLAAPARTGRPALDGITWPDSSEQQAGLLAREALRMVADVQAVKEAYLTTINTLLQELRQGQVVPPLAPEAKPAAQEGAGEAAGAAVVDAEGVKEAGEPGAAAAGMEAAGAEGVGSVVAAVLAALGELAGALDGYAQSATTALTTGYKGLLYTVLLRTVVMQIAQGEEAEAGSGSAGQGSRGASEAGAGAAAVGAAGAGAGAKGASAGDAPAGEGKGGEEEDALEEGA